MMAYRDVSVSMPLRLALHDAIEGKYFGEQASGVGTRTDVYIMRRDKPVFRIGEKVLEDRLFNFPEQLEPRDLQQRHLATLNSLPGKSLSSVSKLKRVKEGSEWLIQGK